MHLKRGSLCHPTALLLLVLAAAGSRALAADFDDGEKLREGNRREGYVSEPVGSKFKLLSFRRGRIPSYQAGDVLTAMFYLPEAGNARITARKLSLGGGRKYAMEAIKDKWDAGWQKFTPWSVDVFLVPEKIRPQNLGIEVRSSDGAFYPPQLFTNGQVKSDSYTIHLYTPSSISKVDYQILDAANGKIREGRISNISSRRAFPIKLRMKGRQEGFYTLSLSIDWKHDPGEHVARYRFYHNPM